MVPKITIITMGNKQSYNPMIIFVTRDSLVKAPYKKVKTMPMVKKYVRENDPSEHCKVIFMRCLNYTKRDLRRAWKKHQKGKEKKKLKQKKYEEI